LEEDVDLFFVGLDAVVEEEALAVFCLALPLALGAGFDPDDEGPALVDGARLGGLKGRRRFFAGWGSPAILSLVGRLGS
jgi:hypothetical protein